MKYYQNYSYSRTEGGSYRVRRVFSQFKKEVKRLDQEFMLPAESVEVIINYNLIVRSLIKTQGYQHGSIWYSGFKGKISLEEVLGLELQTPCQMTITHDLQTVGSLHSQTLSNALHCPYHIILPNHLFVQNSEVDSVISVHILEDHLMLPNRVLTLAVQSLMGHPSDLHPHIGSHTPKQLSVLSQQRTLNQQLNNMVLHSVLWADVLPSLCVQLHLHFYDGCLFLPPIQKDGDLLRLDMVEVDHTLPYDILLPLPQLITQPQPSNPLIFNLKEKFLFPCQLLPRLRSDRLCLDVLLPYLCMEGCLDNTVRVACADETGCHHYRQFPLHHSIIYLYLEYLNSSMRGLQADKELINILGVRFYLFNIFIIKMRTKHSEKKRELENAFSFGQQKNENTFSPTKNNQLSAKSNALLTNFTINLNQKIGKVGNSARRVDAQREPLQKLKVNGGDFETSKEDELLRRFEDYQRKFALGKVIQSETCEESIIQPLQNQLFLMREENEESNTVALEMQFPKKAQSKFYNPSIEDIKKKYGYNPQPRKTELTHHRSITPTDLGYHGQKLQTQERYDKHLKYQRTMNPKTVENEVERPKQSNKYHPNDKFSGNRTRTFDALDTKTSKMVGQDIQPHFGQSTDWVLKSISDLDCKISEKMNRIIAQPNRTPRQKRY